MKRFLRHCVPYFWRFLVFLVLFLIGNLGRVCAEAGVGWLAESRQLSALGGSLAIAAACAFFSLFWLIVLSASGWFAEWDDDVRYEDARRCARCDLAMVTLIKIRGAGGKARAFCVRCLQRQEARGEQPAREARL